jgi:hypothetical protein
MGVIFVEPFVLLMNGRWVRVYFETFPVYKFNS